MLDDRELRAAPPPRGVLSATPVNGELRGRRVLPSPDLAEFIHHFWLVRWDLRSPYTAEALLHPAGRIELEEANGATRAEIAGVKKRRFSRTLQGVGQYFGVQFRPATLQPLLGASMSTLTDRSIPVARSLGPGASPGEHSSVDHLGGRAGLRRPGPLHARVQERGGPHPRVPAAAAKLTYLEIP